MPIGPTWLRTENLSSLPLNENLSKRLQLYDFSCFSFGGFYLLPTLFLLKFLLADGGHNTRISEETPPSYKGRNGGRQRYIIHSLYPNRNFYLYVGFGIACNETILVITELVFQAYWFLHCL